MSFQQGLSGLNASSKSLEVIGNNVANASTVGAKTSRAEFATMYASAMRGGGSNVGIGVQLAAVTQQFSQGGTTTTANSLDLAINGEGFFEVKAADGQTLYTRAGQFQLNKDGFIQNSAGQQLLGYAADELGTIQPGQAVPLSLPTAGIAPRATSDITLEMNLDSREASIVPGTPAVVANDATTYNRATSMTVYDAKGQDVALTYFFQKTGTDTWDVYATANGKALDDATSDVPSRLATIHYPSNGGNPTVEEGGSIEYYQNGGGTTDSGKFSFDIGASTNGAGAETLAISGIELDLSSATQWGQTFGVTDQKQDGYAPGQLAGLSIEKNGIVMATYSNGESKPAGQVELATFRNPQGLQPLGGNNWARTYTSGEPITGTPGQGNLGALQAGALEESNVDLTGELVNMITAQRIYQANSQTIKTQDQVLQTLVNLR